ncbi:hypothetical protein ACET3X_004729 [Alternaria dauci]|uniref:RING-type domain-containing protein n=1 Tax=Alternaria dauci TaxID=48095 RepID=A0ABR3UKQ3_9PLEO
MAMSAAPTLSASYTEFLECTLLPVETPPADANCGICREHFIKNEEKDSLDYLNYCTTTQSRLLAAALAAAMEEEEVIHGEPVQIRNCGHLFHKDCISQWVTGDVLAAHNLRSCPLCKTELVRYGLPARVEYFLLETTKAQDEVNALETQYILAYTPVQRLEELAEDVANIMEEFKYDTNNLSQPTRNLLFTHVHEVLNKQKIWGRDMDYLAQLLLDGHSIPDAIDIWYTFKLDFAREDFNTQSKMLGEQMNPLITRLHDLEYALRDLSADVVGAGGFTMTAFEVQYNSEISGWYEEVLIGMQQWRCFYDDTAMKIEYAVMFAEWMLAIIGQVRNQLSWLDAIARVEREDGAEEAWGAVTVETLEVDLDGMEVEDATYSQEMLLSDDREPDARVWMY